MFLKHHVRFILSSLALCGGVLVLLISLSKSPTAVLSADGKYEASHRQLYLGKEVLPDHVGYPILMAIDRVKLESLNPNDRVYAEIEYAVRRFEYVDGLLAKDNQGLALTTTTKAMKYLFQAGQEAMDQDLELSTKRAAWRALVYHNQHLTELKDKFSADADRAVLDQLLNEGAAIEERLFKALPPEDSNRSSVYEVPVLQ